MRLILAAVIACATACTDAPMTPEEQGEIVCTRYQECIDEAGSPGGTTWCRESIERNPITDDCAIAIANAECDQLLNGHELPAECT